MRIRPVIGIRPTIWPGTHTAVGPTDLIMCTTRPLYGTHVFYSVAGDRQADKPDRPSTYSAGMSVPSFQISPWFPRWGFIALVQFDALRPREALRTYRENTSLDGHVLVYFTEQQVLDIYRQDIQKTYGEDTSRFDEILAKRGMRESLVEAGLRTILDDTETYCGNDPGVSFWRMMENMSDAELAAHVAKLEREAAAEAEYIKWTVAQGVSAEQVAHLRRGIES